MRKVPGSTHKEIMWNGTSSVTGNVINLGIVAALKGLDLSARGEAPRHDISQHKPCRGEILFVIFLKLMTLGGGVKTPNGV